MLPKRSARSAFALLVMALTVTLVQAHGPTRQKVVEKVVIDAPPSLGWARIGNFEGLKSCQPVSNCTSSTLSVGAQGSGSVVEWRGAFCRAYQNNDPPPDQNDYAAVKAISGVYTSGLANLKKLVEGE